jgi:proteasome alpha subunit
MIEEPYRWVEAIANRREYIEGQLAPGSPIAALGYREGILFITLGRNWPSWRYRAVANGRD